jgi:hypothetical protein
MMQMNVNLSKGPDFLMRLGKIGIMHAVSVEIFTHNGREERFKIVDRSFQMVWLNLKNLLCARIATDSLKVSKNAQDLSEFEILATNFRVRIALQFPAKLHLDSQEALSLIFFENLSSFANSSIY